MNKITRHEREFFDLAFDIVYTKDENERRVALNNLLDFILPTIRRAQQELNHYLIESDNKYTRARGQQTPSPTTGMDMLEKLDNYISKFATEVKLYERTRGWEPIV